MTSECQNDRSDKFRTVHILTNVTVCRDMLAQAAKLRYVSPDVRTAENVSAQIIVHVTPADGRVISSKFRITYRLMTSGPTCKIPVCDGKCQHDTPCVGPLSCDCTGILSSLYTCDDAIKVPAGRVSSARKTYKNVRIKIRLNSVTPRPNV